MGRLSMRKISEILRQKHELGLSNRAISESLNISPSTVSDYLSRAKAIRISWPLPDGITEQELYDKFFLPVRVKAVARPLPDWQYVFVELRKKGVTLQLLWREYREQYPDGLGYSQFCRYFNKYKKTAEPVMRQVHKAGEKTFVDYAGMTVEYIDMLSGEVFSAQIFVGCLGASQYIYAEATASQQLPDWISAHINMFEYFGGVTEILVPDNLKSGVTKAHRYDPDINANYQHFAEHYKVAIVPARKVSPKDKAKAESGVCIVERQILAPMRNMTFTSVAQINAQIKIRLAAVNNQQYQKMPVTRKELYENLDKPALKPLPDAKYQYAQWQKAKVHVDYHVSFDKSFYSVPYTFIGKHIEIRATNKTVECFYDNQRIATHARSHKQYSFSTVTEHMPQNHQEHLKFTPERIHRWAAKIGSNTADFIEHMINSRAFPQQAYRACLGLLRLSNYYGNTRLDKACYRALQVGATRYQQVEAILKNNLEEAPIPETKPNVLIRHENIRGSEYYQ